MFGDRPPWASDRGCRGRLPLRCRRPGAVRSRPTGRASWNPAYPGPRGSDLCVRPLFSPHVRRVQNNTCQVEQAGVIEAVHDLLVQPPPHPGPRPDQEPAVRGRLRYPETRRQGTPRASTDQHIDDRRKQRLIRGPTFFVVGPSWSFVRSAGPGAVGMAVIRSPLDGSGHLAAHSPATTRPLIGRRDAIAV